MFEHGNRRRRRLAVTSVAVAVILTAAGVTAAEASTAAPVAAAANTGAAADRHGTKDTFVFVHGAFADSSGWDATISTLRHLGYPVIAAADPLRGIKSDAASIHALLATIPGKVILVGHSYGGAVIANAAVGAPNVKALVFVAAFLPDAGETIGGLLSAFPGSQIGPNTTQVVPFADPTAPGGTNGDVYIKQSAFHSIFIQDADAQTAADLAATQRPVTQTSLAEPSGTPAWKTIPSWDLITLDDHAIPPSAQEFMAKRAGAQVETVHSSHLVMVSHPRAVIDILLDAAKAVG
jgi:pimeloyl-ACP methyl ester carboxylesterase